MNGIGIESDDVDEVRDAADGDEGDEGDEEGGGDETWRGLESRSTRRM